MSGQESIIILESDLEALRSFFAKLEKGTMLKFNTVEHESSFNDLQVKLLNYISDKNIVLTKNLIGPKIITLNLNSLDESIISITVIEPEEEKEEEEKQEELEYSINIDDILEEDTIQYQEASIWELSYNSSTLIEDIVNHLQDNYNRKNINKDIDSLYREANSILDLINKFKKNDDVTDKNIIKHTDEFRPHLLNIINNEHLPSYISPIVYDQKKFYTQNEHYISGQDLSHLDLTDVTFVNETEELEILNSINKRYRDKKNNQFNNHKNILNQIYTGGNINMTDDEQPVAFTGINRSHTNNSPEEDKPITFFNTELKNNTRVVRNCFSDKGCTKDPDDESGDIEKKILISTRLADGEIIVIQDSYDDRFIYETKGEIKSCNSAGDKFYNGLDKTTDLHKTISKPPKHCKYVDGELVNIVGFFIKAIATYKPSIINGNQVVKNEGGRKIYPGLYNNGLTINDACPNNTKHELKIISDHTEFQWNDYDPNFNYVILFKNTGELNSINENTYKEFVSAIVPTIDEIMELEKDGIDNCLNMMDLHIILNKHNIQPHDISDNIIKKYNLTNKFIINSKKMTDYESYVKNKTILSKDMQQRFMKMDNTFLQFKSTIESSLNTSGLIPDSEVYITSLKESFQTMSQPILLQYSNNVLDSFIKNYLEISIDGNIRDFLLSAIHSYYTTSSGSIFVQSEFTKCFTNPEEVIDVEFQELFSHYLIEYNIPINPFVDSHINHFDKNILKHLDFISNMKNDKDNSQEIIDIINLSNLKNLQQNITDTINSYGKKVYNQTKAPEDKDWGELEESVQNSYIPDITIASELKKKIESIRSMYDNQKTIMASALKDCKNIRVMKEYVSLEDLILDNNKTIYTSPKYDTTKLDLTLAKANDLHEDPSNEAFIEGFTKEMKSTYIFESNETIDAKISVIINILNKTESVEARQIISGDFALINDGKRKLLYLRRGMSWVPVDKSSANIEKCFKYDEDFLQLEFDKIKEYCLDYNENKDTACVHTNENNFIINKLYKLYIYYKSLIDKKNNIVKILEYKKRIDNKIRMSFSKLQQRLAVIKNMNKRKVKTVPVSTSLSVSNNVYPPKSILDRLNYIKRIEDFDQRNLQLSDFIGEYGVEFKTIDGIILSDTFWWYNIDKVNVPLICKHNKLLMESALCSSEIKEENMRLVRDEFGVMDGEFYYCKNCGEVIDYQKYSEFEGFGKDDKVINIREIMVDEEEEEDFFENIVALPSKTKDFSDVIKNGKYAVSLILRKINVDLRVGDYQLIMDIIENNLRKILPELIELKTFVYNRGLDILRIQGNDLLLFKNGEEVFESLGKEYDSGSLARFTANLKPTSGDNEKAFSKYFWKKEKKKTKPTKGKMLLLFGAYKTISILCLSICAVCEVIRTAIPDYTVKGSGQEKSQKSGVILNDLFETTNKETGKSWFLSYISESIYTDVSSSASTQYFKAANFLLKTEDGDKKEIYDNYIDRKYQEITNIESISERIRRKKEHRLDTFMKNDDIITYSWDEFLPSLGFNNEYTYAAPDVVRLINSQKDNIARLKQLNKQEKTEALKQSMIKLTSDIQDTNESLKNTEENLGFQLITNINNVITKQALPDNFNPSAYINSSNYDNIKKKYIDNYINTDSSIIDIRGKISIIKEYFVKFAYDINIIYDIVNTTFAPRDLQHFMKLDRQLYNNNDDLIKQALVNKIKQSHFTYNLNEGNNYGELRNFKTITDKDYDLVTQIIMETEGDINELDSDSIKDTLIIKIKEKYGTDYPELNINFKVKLLLMYNGTAEVDLISLEFKNEISENINKLTSSQSIEDIKKVISDIEVNTNRDTIDKKQYKRDELIEHSNIELLNDRVTSMLNNYIGGCDDEPEIRETISELIKIQTGVKYPLNEASAKTIIEQIKTKIKPYICKTTDDTIKSILINIKDERLSAEYSEILNNIININEYYAELIDGIESQLKIEDITDDSIKRYESNFRSNNYRISKFSNKINILISIVRYIISVLSNFHHRLTNHTANNDIESTVFLQKEDRKLIKDMSEDSAKNIHKIIGDTIKSLNGSDIDEYSMNITEFKRINTFLDQLTMYNNTLTNEGNLNKLFVNTPEVFVGTINHIILYLLNLLIHNDDDDDDAETKNRNMSNIFANIMIYIKEVSFVNNITDKTIQNVMDKHRANANQSRLKRFNKKDDEDKGLHNIYRKYNLGNQLVEEEMTIDQSEVGFLTSAEDDTPEIILNADGSDNMEAEQQAEYSVGDFTIDNIYAEDQEEQEETE